MSEVESML